MRAISRIVTIVVVLVVAAGGFGLIYSRMPAQSVGQDFHLFGLFRDGSRLAIGSKVVIAGVRVGEVDRLSIEGGLARADLVLRDVDNKIPVDSWLTKRAESAFGDSYLEIIPGESTTLLGNGAQITHVVEGGSTDTVLRTIARTMPKIDRGLDVVHDFMLSGRRWTEGVLRERADDADRWLVAGTIETPLENADRAMERFENGTNRAGDAIASARPQILDGIERADRAVASARKQIDDVKASLHEQLASARDGMDRVDEPIDNATQLLAAIDAGSGDDWKGSLGRLVNTPDLADDIEDTTDTLREGAAGLNRFKSWIGMRFEYDIYAQIPRVYVTAELNVRNDKFFLVELSRDPLGALPDTDLSDSPNSANYTRTISIADTTRFTLQFGKRFGPLALRAGVKDSTAGAGVDLLLRHNRIRLSGDAFGSWESKPRLKLTASYAVFRSLYVLGGIDDALSTPGYLNILPAGPTGGSPVPANDFNHLRYGRDYFIGAALHFDDADLATLLRVYGALLLAGV